MAGEPRWCCIRKALRSVLVESVDDFRGDGTGRCGKTNGFSLENDLSTSRVVYLRVSDDELAKNEGI